MSAYRLLISFRSNERPWTGTHDPYPRDRFGDDEEEARAWARRFERDLPEYAVTLLKDGIPMRLNSEGEETT